MSADYSVQRIHGCTIIRGSLPISDLVALTSGQDKRVVIAPTIGSRLGACMVFGTPEALEDLKAANLPACTRVQEEIAAARSAGLGQDAIDWLDGYERGSSSECLFTLATGVKVGFGGHYLPHDSGDFGRCLNLVRSVAAVRDNLDKVRAEPEWGRVIDRWQELERLYEEQAHSEVRDRLRGA